MLAKFLSWWLHDGASRPNLRTTFDPQTHRPAVEVKESALWEDGVSGIRRGHDHNPEGLWLGCRSFIWGLQWLGSRHRDGLKIFAKWFLSRVQTMSCQSKIIIYKEKNSNYTENDGPTRIIWLISWWFVLYTSHCFHHLREGHIPRYWAKNTSGTHSVVLERLAMMLNKAQQSMASMLV